MSPLSASHTLHKGPRDGSRSRLSVWLTFPRSPHIISVHMAHGFPCSCLTASTPQASTSSSDLTGIPCCIFSWSRVSLCFCTCVNTHLCVSERSPFGNQENVRWRKSVTHWRQTSDRVDKWVKAGHSSQGLDQFPENCAPRADKGKAPSCRGRSLARRGPPKPLPFPLGPRMKWNTRPW